MVRSQASRPRRTIGAFAAAAGVGVETVRYYQRRGLLPVPAARGRQREYDDALLARLVFVRKAQAAGFTLAEIGELLRLDRSTDRARIRVLAEARRAEIAARIEALREASRALGRLVEDCAHGDPRAPCPIVAAFADR